MELFFCAQIYPQCIIFPGRAKLNVFWTKKLWIQRSGVSIRVQYSTEIMLARRINYNYSMARKSLFSGSGAALAQLAEQLTLNQRVRGSSPWWVTI